MHRNSLSYEWDMHLARNYWIFTFNDNMQFWRLYQSLRNCQRICFTAKWELQSFGNSLRRAFHFKREKRYSLWKFNIGSLKRKIWENCKVYLIFQNSHDHCSWKTFNWWCKISFKQWSYFIDRTFQLFIWIGFRMLWKRSYIRNSSL